jgi:hypothetical protein
VTILRGEPNLQNPTCRQVEVSDTGRWSWALRGENKYSPDIRGWETSQHPWGKVLEYVACDTSKEKRTPAEWP